LSSPDAGFFRRYRDAILFNRNLIISGAAGFLASAYASHLFSLFSDSDLANSAVALATEYAVYLPLFALLFYLDNRHRYVDPQTGRKNHEQIRQDVKKLFAAFSVSEVVFSIVRVLSQYGLLQASLEPYEASMISSVVSWTVFFVSINLMARLVRLFQKP
jgi:Na+/melibiose symporter-like transporter